MATETYEKFIARVRDIRVVETISEALEWDQETYMPPKGTALRAAQMELLAGIAHAKLLDPEYVRLLDAVEAERFDDPVIATNVREARRMYDRKAKLPTRLVQELAQATTLAREAWVKARQDSDFAQFAPHLRRLLELKREAAERIGYQAEPYDALLDEFEPGARSADVEGVFAALQAELVPLLRAIQAAPRQPDVALLRRGCPRAAQEEFGRQVVAAMGFDFEAGRLDTTTHPFCTGLYPRDVRLTARYDENYLPMALFGLLHEAGHGLYEQGLDPTHAGTPMGRSVSLGIHESQSRLWENMIGRSRAFWEYYWPRLQAAFPAFADATLDDWHFAINAVRPSLIRVEADEVTYNLHIVLRFDLERKLLAGRLAVRDIPAAWNAAMQALLGITPANDAQGCLQDIHWSMGIFGYFPTYALGNLYAAQFYEAIGRALPELEAQLRRGELAPLRAWLRENIHRHGMRYRAGELVERVTGQPLSHAAFMAYLTRKYRALYRC